MQLITNLINSLKIDDFNLIDLIDVIEKKDEKEALSKEQILNKNEEQKQIQQQPSSLENRIEEKVIQHTLIKEPEQTDNKFEEQVNKRFEKINKEKSIEGKEKSKNSDFQNLEEIQNQKLSLRETILSELPKEKKQQYYCIEEIQLNREDQLLEEPYLVKNQIEKKVEVKKEVDIQNLDDDYCGGIILNANSKLRRNTRKQSNAATEKQKISQIIGKKKEVLIFKQDIEEVEKDEILDSPLMGKKNGKPTSLLEDQDKELLSQILRDDQEEEANDHDFKNNNISINSNQKTTYLGNKINNNTGEVIFKKDSIKQSRLKKFSFLKNKDIIQHKELDNWDDDDDDGDEKQCESKFPQKNQQFPTSKEMNQEESGQKLKQSLPNLQQEKQNQGGGIINHNYEDWDEDL